MLAAMLAFVPMAIMNAFVAFLLWVYVTSMSLHAYMYGFMGQVRYAFIFAALSLGLLLLGRVKDRGSFIWNKSTVLLLLFMFHAILSAVFSLQPNPNVAFRLEFFLKGMVLALAAPFFLTTQWRIHVMLVVLVASLGFHGVIDGLKMIASGGSHIIHGIPRSTLSDNNLYAVGMVMLLPITLYLAKYSAHRIAKWTAITVFALCVMTVLGSNSRGGFLALAILGAWYWITSPRKLVSSVVVACIAIGVVQFAPERWFDRIETIKDAAEDQSFLGRVAAWKVSVNIANDNPIFGAGFHAVENQWIWNKYKDADNIIPVVVPDIIAKAAHSNYFQVLGDLGYVGFFIFLALLSTAFITRWEIKRYCSEAKVDKKWAVDLATSLNLSIVAFMAGGAGVSLAYFELVFLMVILMAIVYRTIRDENGGVPGYKI